MKPPQYKTMPRRPKKKRVKAPEETQPKQTTRGTEKLSQKGKDIVCSICKEAGHNKRGYKKSKANNETDAKTNASRVQDSGVKASAVQASGVSEAAGTSKTKRKPKEKGTTPVARVYTKNRNEGMKKTPQVPEGEKRKRGRPRKKIVTEEPTHDFCGIYVTPSGQTFYKSWSI